MSNPQRSDARAAFCPGHVTAFFEICDEGDDPLDRGSRGAGLCLSLGAKSAVRIVESDAQEVVVRIDGERSPAEVTADVVKYIICNKNLHVEVETSLDLPVGQGFGMSAAGALSVSLALCDLLSLDRSLAFEAAHVAEIRNQSGLGDVSGLFAGGLEVRSRAGLPPGHGEVQGFDLPAEIVLCVVGRPIRTSDVITDSARRKSISSVGGRCVQEFLEDPTIEHLFALGAEFTEEAGLFSSEVLSALLVADEHGMASMVMLGNSIFCCGDSDKLMETLGPLGRTYRCTIDAGGPRLIG